MKKAQTILDIFQQYTCRFENEPGELYCLCIIDRKVYPRLWIDSGIANETKIINESTDHLLIRSNPFLEKDWIVRFEAYTMDEIVEQFNNWNNN